MADYLRVDQDPEATERERAAFGPFTAAVRDLVDATIRSRVDPDEVRAAQAEVEAIVARLRRTQIDGSYGVPHAADGHGRPWGNSVVGLRNAIAPPVVVERDPRGRSRASFHLGAAYEGPPGLVHGGVSALILDQMLGEAAGAGGRPGMTASLTTRYRRATPLGDLHAEAWIERVEGHKTWVHGHIADAEGVTVEADGLFILPRWARDRLAQATGDAAP